MKPLLIASALAATLASPAVAQHLYYDFEIVDGVRELKPDEEGLNARGFAVQDRIYELGFFSWPIPREKASVDPALQPSVVFDCDGHDPEYRPANKIRFDGDMDKHLITQSQGIIYDWMAYRNAIVAGDCGCGSLRADWDEAKALYEQVNDGLNERSIQRNFLGNLHVLIQNDYERMCDVRMSLDLE